MRRIPFSKSAPIAPLAWVWKRRVFVLHIGFGEPVVCTQDSSGKKAQKLLTHKLYATAVNPRDNQPVKQKKMFFSWVQRRTH